MPKGLDFSVIVNKVHVGGLNITYNKSSPILLLNDRYIFKNSLHTFAKIIAIKRCNCSLSNSERDYEIKKITAEIESLKNNLDISNINPK